MREWAVAGNFSLEGPNQPYLRQKSLETSLQLAGQDESVWVKSPGSVCWLLIQSWSLRNESPPSPLISLLSAKASFSGFGFLLAAFYSIWSGFDVLHLSPVPQALFPFRSFLFFSWKVGFFCSICLFSLGIIPTSYKKLLLCHCCPTLSSLEPFKGFFCWFLRFANTLWSLQWEIHRYHLGSLAVSSSQVTECSQRCPDFIIKLLRISFWVMWVIPTSAALEWWPPALSVLFSSQICCSKQHKNTATSY